MPSCRARTSVAPLPTTEKGDLKSSLLQQADPQTIAHIEALAQLPLGVEPEAPIGEHTVYIQDQQLNGFQALPQQPPAQPVHARPACTRSCRRSSPIS